jgi:hypothetical protein
MMVIQGKTKTQPVILFYRVYWNKFAELLQLMFVLKFVTCSVYYTHEADTRIC